MAGQNVMPMTADFVYWLTFNYELITICLCLYVHTDAEDSN